MDLEARKVAHMAPKSIECRSLVSNKTLSGTRLIETPSESDDAWVRMLRASYIAECKQRRRTGVRADLRSVEIEAADRKVLWQAVKASYSRRKDTLSWAAAVFVTSGSIVAVFSGLTLGLLSAIAISAIWTAVHAVRHV